MLDLAAPCALALDFLYRFAWFPATACTLSTMCICPINKYVVGHVVDTQRWRLVKNLLLLYVLHLAFTGRAHELCACSTQVW